MVHPAPLTKPAAGEYVEPRVGRGTPLTHTRSGASAQTNPSQNLGRQGKHDWGAVEFFAAPRGGRSCMIAEIHPLRLCRVPIPVGQEAWLTRAMKAYHLEKAHDPSDLLAWLFDKKERRRPEPELSSRSRRHKDDYDDNNYEPVEKPRAEPPVSRGLRDIYVVAAAVSSTSLPSTNARSTQGPHTL
ncbi:hypothetical protein K438DRAFT_1962151 [Mycena galopus ATCC 62051]|nr:hypothetical protein K438DRAFT_1962151 [Mycena galopus ATCC 62051]